MRRVMVGLAMTVLATTAGAQTTDHFYRSWTFAQEVGDARAAGLGGAAVALEADAGVVAWNPATAATVHHSEILVGGLSRATGDGRLGDATASRQGIGMIGGAGLVGRTIAIGGYLIEPHAQNWTLGSGTLSDGSADTGYLRSVVTEAGGVLAWRPTPKVSLGLAVSGSHLEMEGQWTRTVNSVQDLRVGTSAGSTKITAAVGAMLMPTDAVTLGLSVTPKVTYAATRTAVSNTLGTLEANGAYDVRRPMRVTAGVAWRATRRVLVVAEADYVRYSDLLPAVRIGVGSPSEFAPSDAIEPRGGVEVSLPAGAVSVQARVGAHYEGRSGLSYSGSDALNQMVFAPRDRRFRPSGGASLVGRRMRLDGAVELSNRPVATLTGGITF